MATTARKSSSTARKKGVVTRDAHATSGSHDQSGRLQATISRLRAEQDRASEAGRSQGRKDGEEWAHSASLVELRYVCEAGDTLDGEELVLLLSEEWVNEYVACHYEGHDRPSFMLGYSDGFREGALTIWAHFM